MTLPPDRIGDKGQRFVIDVQCQETFDMDEIGYADYPSAFNDAIGLMPRWKRRSHHIVITDRKPGEGSVGMLLGMLKDSKVKAALLRAGCILPRLENVLRKELKSK